MHTLVSGYKDCSRRLAATCLPACHCPQHGLMHETTLTVCRKDIITWKYLAVTNNKQPNNTDILDFRLCNNYIIFIECAFMGIITWVDPAVPLLKGSGSFLSVFRPSSPSLQLLHRKTAKDKTKHIFMRLLFIQVLKYFPEARGMLWVLVPAALYQLLMWSKSFIVTLNTPDLFFCVMALKGKLKGVTLGPLLMSQMLFIF